MKLDIPYAARDIDLDLKQWAAAARRDVLLVRGARQVGKSSSVQKLGRDFDSFVEVNFEENPELKEIFMGARDPYAIITKLSAYFGTKIEPGKTLLFFDEIQECENALHALRFFKEKIPELHVIAAGSLLEFVLASLATFGVGRISSMYMYPLNFGEFLQAVHSKELRSLMLESSVELPFDSPIHRSLLEAYRVYSAIGGLPEVVSMYLQEKDLHRCEVKLSSLVSGYIADFAKYRKKIAPERIQETFLSAASQAGSKFTYAKISDSGGAKDYKGSLNALVTAGLCYKVHHSSCSGSPIGAEKNLRKFKVIPFDLGVFQNLNNLNISKHVVSTEFDLVNKGSAAEVFVGLELVSYAKPFSRPELFYWHREARSSNAEVDYVVQLDGQIVPMEVKSGGKGSMKSLQAFFANKDPEFGLRVSQENFCEFEKIKVLPIVALEQLRGRLF